MNSAERREYELDFTGPPPKILYDFHAIRIRVYKNGDERDPGKLITITRREYKHWFTELEHNGEYVAVERGPFIECSYGAYRVWTQTERAGGSLERLNKAGQDLWGEQNHSVSMANIRTTGEAKEK
ncbi:hypothetical protein TELCIR_02871, partial [Teladorsagia circumcincta]